MENREKQQIFDKGGKRKKKKKDIQFVSTVDIIESVSSGFFPRIKKKETKEK